MFLGFGLRAGGSMVVSGRFVRWGGGVGRHRLVGFGGFVRLWNLL